MSETNKLISLESIKKERNEEACQNALAELEKCAADDGNLMASAIEGCKTSSNGWGNLNGNGEMFGRHKTVSQSISGVYRKEYEGDEDFMNVEIK